MNLNVLDPVSFFNIQGLTHILIIEVETATETGINPIRTLIIARKDLIAFSFPENFKFRRTIKTAYAHRSKCYEPSPWIL
jgi:hypothetical protein